MGSTTTLMGTAPLGSFSPSGADTDREIGQPLVTVCLEEDDGLRGLRGHLLPTRRGPSGLLGLVTRHAFHPPACATHG